MTPLFMGSEPVAATRTGARVFGAEEQQGSR